MHYRYIFGPVPSRRLGASLGIDLSPHKTCTLDCVYCECGQTTNLTLERKEYVPTIDVIGELDSFLSCGPALDHITFSGSGEPTLHSRIADIIGFIRSKYPGYKIALLTNGTLFFNEEVRRDVMDVDVILPSIDAGTDAVFRAINRPHKDLDLENIVQGIVDLKSEFKGKMWLEVMIVPGVNNGKDEIDKIRDAIFRIHPDKVQINSLDRPGAEEWVGGVDANSLRQISKKLGGEVIGKPYSITSVPSFQEDIAERILSAITRRPCTMEDISASLGLHVNETGKYVDYLENKGAITSKIGKRGRYYLARK